MRLHSETGTTGELIARFTDRYRNANTRRHYRGMLSRLFADTGATHPDDLTEADVLTWCHEDRDGRRRSNNSVRSQASIIATFYRWCVREGVISHNPTEHFTGSDSPLRRIPRVYGRVQATNPGRWLSHAEAYCQLLTACEDGTDAGLRDELAIRFGLLGLRAAEIAALRFHNINDDTITWLGKGGRQRTATTGHHLAHALSQLVNRYTATTGNPPTADDPVICRSTPAGGHVRYGTPAAYQTIYRLVTKRAHAAGLGHVAPHDLRRTAAGILHHHTDNTGAHHFDLLDIQKVLGHADPATTMRSYLDPLDHAVYNRAADILD